MLDRLTPVHAFLGAVALAIIAVLATNSGGQGIQLSRWAGASGNNALSGIAAPQAGAVSEPGLERLAAYNAGSELLDQAAGGHVSFYRRALGAGNITYFVVQLDGQAEVRLVNANGATPGSDASGDTIWTDGQRHLAPVQEMVTAPYAQQAGKELLGAINFGFHGARSSNEGSVVIDGQLLRVNAGRAALCVTAEGRAEIGLFDAEQLRGCAQAVGGGPVVVWQGKIANPESAVASGEFIPFNPLGEDFVQLDWRRMIYTGTYPKTMVGVGNRPDGRSYLVLLTSSGLNGIEVARALVAMGCTSVLGGDDDSSTQAVWRGSVVQGSAARPVPDALAIYAPATE